MVERIVDIDEVAGSSPVLPTIKILERPDGSGRSSVRVGLGALF